MSDEQPTERPVGDPLEPFTEAEVIAKARGVVTGQYMLADLNDIDWQHSLMLMIVSMADVPPNASMLWLVPLAPHANGRWLNGRVPGTTTSAEIVPMESVDGFLDQVQTFWRLLNPDVAPVPQSGP